jgi:hypothetical protein
LFGGAVYYAATQGRIAQPTIKRYVIFRHIATGIWIPVQRVLLTMIFSRDQAGRTLYPRSAQKLCRVRCDGHGDFRVGRGIRYVQSTATAAAAAALCRTTSKACRLLVVEREIEKETVGWLLLLQYYKTQTLYICSHPDCFILRHYPRNEALVNTRYRDYYLWE